MINWTIFTFKLIDYEGVGCYRDTGNRAIPTIEGTDPILDGGYRSRQNAIAKCAIAASKNGYHMFAVQHGGWCAASATAEKTFDKYGKSNDCQNDGEGGPWANNVYIIQGSVGRSYCTCSLSYILYCQNMLLRTLHCVINIMPITFSDNVLHAHQSCSFICQIF